VLFRALQGLVAGPMIPLSQTLLLASYPKAKAGTALALWGMTTLVAPVAGPLLGGWITDNFTWPWIFYINVPVGLLAAGISWSIYRKRETVIRKLPIDSIGLALLILWVGSLQLMLDKGKELDWFHSGTIQILAVVAVVAFLFFVIWEWFDAHPVVDLHLFRGRNFTFGVISISIAYGLFFGNLVLLPLWLQQWMGYTAVDAGWALAPVGFLAILISPIVGKQVSKRDPRIIATVAFLTFALVLWMRANFTTGTDLPTIMLPTVIQGAAMACFFIPLTTIILAGIPPERMAAAAGLSNFVRIMFGAMGTSISTTLWENRATLHHARLIEARGQLGDPIVGQTVQQLHGVAGFTDAQSAGFLNRLIDQQAFTRAADDIFLASALCFLLLIGTLWLTRRPAQQAGGAADAAGAH